MPNLLSTELHIAGLHCNQYFSEAIIQGLTQTKAVVRCFAVIMGCTIVPGLLKIIMMSLTQFLHENEPKTFAAFSRQSE